MSAADDLIARAAGDLDDEQLREAGFHRMLVPERHGGLALRLGDCLAVVATLARRSPGVAWRVGALASSALTVAMRFPDDVQAAVFANGESRCTPVAAPAAVATRSGGGWTIDGELPGCPGAGTATHCLGQALGEDGPLVFVAPAAAFAVEESHGAGLAGAAAGTVRLERAAIADGWARPGTLPALVAQAVLTAVFTGAAASALERFEALTAAEEGPSGPRRQDPDAQRWLGGGVGRVAAAQLLLGEVAEQVGSAPPAREDDLRLALMAREAMRLAWTGVREMARTAGRDRGAFEALARDLLGGWGEPAVVVEEVAARELARERLQIPA